MHTLVSCLQAVSDLPHFPRFTSGIGRCKSNSRTHRSVDFSELYGALRCIGQSSRANFSRYCEIDEVFYSSSASISCRKCFATSAKTCRCVATFTWHSVTDPLFESLSRFQWSALVISRSQLQENDKNMSDLFRSMRYSASFPISLTRMKISIFVCGLRRYWYVEFCGFIELTFHKVGEWKWVSEARRYFHLPMRNRRGKATSRGYSISGVCCTPTWHCHQEFICCWKMHRFLVPTYYFRGVLHFWLGSSSLHLQGGLGRKINIWFMFFEWIRSIDFPFANILYWKPLRFS